MATQSAPILVTRPQAEAEAFAAALTARFGPAVRPVISPLLAPRNLAFDLPSRDYAAVVFTSAQAVEAVRPIVSRLPKLAWCVGRRTAAVAGASGFDARSSDGDAKALVSLMTAKHTRGYMLYLRGVDTSYNLLQELRKFGANADECIVYVQDPQPLTPEAIALLQAPVDLFVPLLSPRTARLFTAAQPPDRRARLHVAAMSRRVAEAAEGLPRVAMAIAPHPDTPGMIAAVESLLVAAPPP